MIVIPTIPGSGTHFMRDHLLADQETYCRHISEKELPRLLELMAKHPAIVPLREPDAIRATWERLARDNHAGWDLDKYIETMNDVVLPRATHRLNIDMPNIREEQLGQINTDLGLHLTTDWRVLRGRAQADAHLYRDTASPPCPNTST